MKNYEYYYNSFVETFVQQQYEWLCKYAKNSTVVDMGAQTGDSSIYFLQNGANFVYAYEPDKLAYEELEKNMMLFYNDNYMLFPINVSEPFSSDNIYFARKEDLVIKCDVEGAEHKIFTSEANLDHVKALQIEYHGGFSDIADVLKRKGFQVRVFKPWKYDNTLGIVGWLHAWRD